MASDEDPDASSSSSSSSSSSDEESVASQEEQVEREDVNDDREEGRDGYQGDADDDRLKAFLSRIPQTFNEDSVKRLLESKFGDGCAAEVSIVYEVPEDEDNPAGEDAAEKNNNGETAKHRGFGYVRFSTIEQQQAALEAGTVRGKAKENSKRKHTLYIQPVVREHEAAENRNKNICFLFRKFRCPYGDQCKFEHSGEGGCLTKNNESKTKKEDLATRTIKERKNRKKEAFANSDVCKKARDKSEIHCINWKNKGKCRKKDCPYLHDEAVKEKVLQKKQGGSKKRQRVDKDRQPLSIRVFGMNYETTEANIRTFFKDCGPIVELTFPLFEDSGRSKGYCGVRFQSPKAVAKAVALNGKELQGRWLSIQEGKMFLRKWEQNETLRREDQKDASLDCGEERGKPLVGEFGQKMKKRKRHGHKVFPTKSQEE